MRLDKKSLLFLFVLAISILVGLFVYENNSMKSEGYNKPKQKIQTDNTKESPCGKEISSIQNSDCLFIGCNGFF